jgi:ankyrin repeat protein
MGVSIEEPNPEGELPVHIASEAANYDAVVLVANRTNVHKVTADGCAPLHYAVRGHNADIVELLLKLGAEDVNARNAAGETPLSMAVELDDTHILELMADYGGDLDAVAASGRSALYTAAWRGLIQTVALLCRRGAKVDQQNSDGWSALFAAALRGHLAVVQMLVEKWHAAINIQTKQGTTPLYHACEHGRVEVARYLLDHGADVNLGSENGWRPVHVAVDNAKLLDLLLSRGAKIEVKVAAAKDYTPLHLAVSVSKPESAVITMLLDKGADTSASNENGQTALHLAVFRGQLEAVKTLCEHPTNPADPKKKNAKGRTALDLAVFCGEKAIAEYLANQIGVECPAIKEDSVHKLKTKTAESPRKPPPPDEFVKHLKKGKLTDSGRLIARSAIPKSDSSKDLQEIAKGSLGSPPAGPGSSQTTESVTGLSASGSFRLVSSGGSGSSRHLRQASVPKLVWGDLIVGKEGEEKSLRCPHSRPAPHARSTNAS